MKSEEVEYDKNSLLWYLESRYELSEVEEKRDSQKSQSRTKIDKDNPERNPNRDFFERFQEKWQNRVKWLK